MTSRSDDTRPVRRQARRAGYRDDCPECMRALMRGREACLRHYVPVASRPRGS